MLRTIINFGKNLLLTIIFCALLVVSIPAGHSYADYSENDIRDVQVVIRAGEWANDKQAKSGKRYSWGQDINISQHGISIKDIPTDIPLRKENNEWFISEFDINLKLAKAIAKKLDSKYGVDVNLQYATSKSQDLNAAGRIASKCNPKIYLSVHHNSYNDTSTGYFFMYNKGDYNSEVVAKKLSNSFSDNGMIPQKDNRANDGYIGELNSVAKEGRISILGEFGFFNKAEIVKICSDEYVTYVSDKVAESIYHQLQNMNEIKQAEENTKESMYYVAEKEGPKEIIVRFTNNDYTVENVDEVVVSFK